jgi:hypothetical protein
VGKSLGIAAMKDFAGLGHLFVVSFLFYFSSFMVIPAITDVTMEAVCPGRDECSVAIYLSGFQNAVSKKLSSCPSSIPSTNCSFCHAHRSPGWGRSW